MPAVKEKEAEASEQPDEEKNFDMDIIETSDLKIEKRQIKKLGDQIARLQKDFNQRQTNLELNIKQLRRDRDEKVAALRDKYDACLGRGDATGADKCLDEIRKAHEDLENLARNVMDADKDFSDLKKRRDELHLAVSRLYEMSLSNFELSKSLMTQASNLSGTMSYSVGRDVQKLENTITETIKIAEIILAE